MILDPINTVMCTLRSKNNADEILIVDSNMTRDIIALVMRKMYDLEGGDADEIEPEETPRLGYYSFSLSLSLSLSIYLASI